MTFASVAIILQLCASEGGASTISLAWDPVADPRVAGYTLHHGTESGSYTSSIDVASATQHTLTSLNPGSMHFFAVTAYDAVGGTSPYSEELVVAPASPPVPLTADFATQPSAGTVPLTVTFIATTQSAVTSYVWDFGDGNGNAYASDAPAPMTAHTYSVPGIYTVRLSVSGPAGTDVVTKPSHVVAASPRTARYACPCSLWNADAVPRTPSVASTAAVTVGVRFASVIDGHVTAVRFYKGDGNSGPHTAGVWTATGQRLAAATLNENSLSGWQQVTFASPVFVQAGTSYVASYHAPHGRHASDRGHFLKSLSNGPLRALAHSTTAGNGVHAYGSVPLFPRTAGKQTNYWVDVVFVPAEASPDVQAARR